MPHLRRYLICNRKGQPYSLNGFQSQWQRVMRKAMQKGLAERFHFHDLRAKSASDDATDQGAADRLGMLTSEPRPFGLIAKARAGTRMRLVSQTASRKNPTPAAAAAFRVMGARQVGRSGK